MKWLAPRSEVKDSKTTMVYFSNFTNPAKLFGRGGKRYIFASLFQFAPLAPACQSAGASQLLFELTFAEHFMDCRGVHCRARGRWLIFIYEWAIRLWASSIPAPNCMLGTWQSQDPNQELIPNLWALPATAGQRLQTALAPGGTLRLGSWLCWSSDPPVLMTQGKSSQPHTQSLAFKSSHKANIYPVLCISYVNWSD